MFHVFLSDAQNRRSNNSTQRQRFESSPNSGGCTSGNLCSLCDQSIYPVCDIYLMLLHKMRSRMILMRNTHTARLLEPVPLCVWCWAHCREPSGSGKSPSCRGWRSSASDVRRVSPPLSFHPASTGPSLPGTRGQADVVSHPPPGRPAQRWPPLAHWLPALQLELTAPEGKLEEMETKKWEIFIIIIIISISCTNYWNVQNSNINHEVLAVLWIRGDD